MGGVENHLFNLSQNLILRGHKVIIITHAYGERSGVRWLTNGLKVYYLPIPIMYNQCSYTTMFSNIVFIRSVLIREQINLVHGHQAFSNLCHEGIFHARSMGIPCCFTDHSLFGFSDTSSILTNKLLKFTLSDVESSICVSHTSKENTVLRAKIRPENVYVIPNAIINHQFQPDFRKRDTEFSIQYLTHTSVLIFTFFIATIVVLSRLVYRKGIDLLVALIPRICQKFENVKFLIAGDGPKRIDLEQMKERYDLRNRVEMVGAVPSEEAPKILVQGHIFLNTSLTEAFCMAILEAASCGCYIVSTNVGGIPEVLPPSMISLSAPSEDQIFANLSQAITLVENNQIHTHENHKILTQMYSWQNVTERTEVVYMNSVQNKSSSCIYDRLVRYYGIGVIQGKLGCLALMLDYLLLLILEVFVPKESIDVAPEFLLDSSDQSQ